MKVVVDLTPVRPGGVNGGAKPLVLELVRQLGIISPKTSFILLTAYWSHAELAALDSSNIRRLCVIVEAPAERKSTDPSFIEKGLSVVKRTLGVNNSHSESHLPPRLDKINPDLVFCPFTAPFFIFPGVPVVSLVYDLQSLEYPYFFSAEEQIERKYNFHKACKEASYLICISEFTRESVLRLSPNQLSPERVLAIPIYLPQESMQRKIADMPGLLKEYDLKHENFLLYPANFWMHKNHKMLLTAFSMYCHQHPNSTLKLVCTGTPGEKQDVLIDAAKKMNIRDRVVFSGYVTSEALNGLLSACKAMIFPSLYEGFGIPVVEAMLAGKPVLCSQKASLPEVAGEFAFYFNPGKPLEIMQAIEKVDVDLNSDLSEKIISAYEHSLQYLGTEKMAKAYQHIFKQAIENHQFTNSLQGVSEDGWAGEKISIIYEPSQQNRVLEITFKCPPWHPKAPVKIVEGKQNYEIKAGEDLIIKCPLEKKGGLLTLSIKEGLFQPSACGMGEDSRFLACLFQNAEIVSENQRVKLCP